MWCASRALTSCAISTSQRPRHTPLVSYGVNSSGWEAATGHWATREGIRGEGLRSAAGHAFKAEESPDACDLVFTTQAII